MRKRENFLPIAIPDITKKEKDQVLESLDTGWISTGPKVKEFEEKFAEYQNTNYAIAVSSCTAALFLIAKCLGIQEGDHVIVPTITWPSTANIVEQLGATPVFVDVDLHTMNTTPKIIKERILEYKEKIKLIIPVHMSGLPVDIDKIQKVGKKYDIPVTYDAAHAVFSEYKNKKVGQFGIASSFSFYAIKNMTTGDGGIITLNDQDLYEKIKLWSYHGMDKDAWKRYSEEGGSPHVEAIVPGYKFNMTDLNAGLGLAQLSRKNELLSKRNQLIEYYFENLKNIDSIELPVIKSEYGKWGNHVFVIKLLDEQIDRNRMINVLRKFNIGTNIHFLPCHKNYYYRKKYPNIELPNSEWLMEHIISLPLCTKYSKKDIKYVSDVVKYIIDKKLAHKH